MVQQWRMEKTSKLKMKTCFFGSFIPDGLFCNKVKFKPIALSLGESLTNHKISLKRVLVTSALVLLVVCILMSATSKTMFAQAADQSIKLFPAEGIPGKTVVVNGWGYTAGTVVTITFDGTVVNDQAQGYGFQNQLSASFTVPDVEFGTYDVVASNREGSATATFTVGNPDATATPTESSDNSQSSTSDSSATATPRYTSRTTADSSDLSPYVIAGIAVVAIAIIIPVLFVMRGRAGERDSLLDRERDSLREPSPFRSERFTPPPSRPGSSYSQSTRYNPPTAYGRSATYPASSSRYGQSTYGYSSSGEKPTSTRACPHCKKVIRADYRSCPYCYKKV
jgi:hypothetical protein